MFFEKPDGLAQTGLNRVPGLISEYISGQRTVADKSANFRFGRPFTALFGFDN